MADLNKAGRPIWFRHVEGGAYRPVTRAGVAAFVFGFGWLLVCGTLGMAAFAVTLDARWIVAMIAATALGLAAFVATVIRHA